ncbi:histone deacetylase [Pseudactinotalea sp. Z1739]|uniref:histone deacetylase n=1 Tax=Pseudactinotalea sp. Z1739 TaxID=3413028 RepID=UPI003C7B82FE
MDEVWYVSYGSNMSRQRLLCYLKGGCPPGGARTYPGARDPSPPTEAVAVHLPGRIYFAGHSLTWGGGMAFYDHHEPGPTPARAYRITVGQFADITAQEMRREPVANGPLEQLLAGGLTDSSHRVGPGRYETLVDVGARDGLPMLTFTSPGGLDRAEHVAPTAAYLAMLTQGLREGHGWSDERIAVYLEGVLP